MQSGTLYKHAHAGGKVMFVYRKIHLRSVAIVKENFVVRTHSYPYCGLIIDRDVNATKISLKED